MKRGLGACVWLVGAIVAGCASAPPPPPAAVEHADDHPVVVDDGADAAVAVDTPERMRAASTASYEDATSVPEAIDVNDDRVQLSDAQLTGPMRGVLAGCRVPSSAKVTIKTAVQDGRAIGVTVSVVFDHPKSSKKLSNATIKAEAKTSAKIVKCADRAVRAVVWPPSRRRDSFTTVF